MVPRNNDQPLVHVPIKVSKSVSMDVVNLREDYVSSSLLAQQMEENSDYWDEEVKGDDD